MCIFVIMIFLTGGTGLVGSHILLKLCENNIPVRALKRQSSSLNICKKVFNYYNRQDLFNTIEWCTGNINDVPFLESSMSSCDYIIHAAALVSFNKSDLEDLKRINIEGTSNIMNVALGLDIKKCIYISSIATLGISPNMQEINEECDFKFTNCVIILFNICNSFLRWVVCKECSGNHHIHKLRCFKYITITSVLY